MSWHTALGGLFDLLYPQGLACPCCGAALDRVPEEALCPACEASLSPFDAASLCPRCFDTHPFFLCPEPKSPLDAVLCALDHQDAASKLVHALKYQSLRAAAAPLAARMSKLIRPDDWDALIPLPLHRRRLRERGFNQAQLLGEGISARTGLPMAFPLVRVRATRRQVGLSRAARQRNVMGAFACTAGVPALRLLLVDDVYTTGATARAAALVLLKAGAGRVGIVTATHALDDR